MALRGHEDATGPGWERRDVRLRPVVVFTLGIAAAIGLALVSMSVLLAVYDARPGPDASPLAAEYARTAPPEPRLQAAPLVDLGALRATEDARLERYAWTDREAGRVQIPIERAMDVLAERGRSAR